MTHFFHKWGLKLLDLNKVVYYCPLCKQERAPHSHIEKDLAEIFRQVHLEKVSK